MKKSGRNNKVIRIRGNDFLVLRPNDEHKLKHYVFQRVQQGNDQVETRNVPLNRWNNLPGMSANWKAYQHSYDDPAFRHLHNYDQDSYLQNAARPDPFVRPSSKRKNKNTEVPSFKNFYGKTSNKDDVPTDKPSYADDEVYFRINRGKPLDIPTIYNLKNRSYDKMSYLSKNADEDENVDRDKMVSPDGELDGDHNYTSDSVESFKDEFESPFDDFVDADDKDEDLDDETVEMEKNSNKLDKIKGMERLNGEDGVKKQDNPNLQGIIRSVPGAYLVFKRKESDDTFKEVWIYNSGKDTFEENKIRKKILSATDIDPDTTTSPDEKQKSHTYTLGNVQFLELSGLPN